MDARVQRLERRDAYMFGVEDDKGMWQRHVEETNVIRANVGVLMEFRGKAMLLVTLGGSVLGLIAGFAAILVEHAFK